MQLDLNSNSSSEGKFGLITKSSWLLMRESDITEGNFDRLTELLPFKYLGVTLRPKK